MTVALSENDSDVQSGDDKKHSVASSVGKPSMKMCCADITKPQATRKALADPLSAAHTCERENAWPQ